jgi:glycosyltransferase involved in cell wall biosynthesis/carbonic anhydrase/acetyltransferase-like protein (isoleucine patch superfamily)
MFHCYIPHTVEIGPGFEVGYWGLGIVIHPRVKIGRNVFVANGVTIGGRNERPEVPRIDDDVYIATGAKILGNITIGTGSVIGANAVVIRDVPPRSIAVGVPARISRENIDSHDYTGWPKRPADESRRSQNSATVRSSPPALRVFHMAGSLDMGGSEHQMVEIGCRQKSRGHEIKIGCLSKKGPLLAVLERNGIEVAEFNPPGGLLGPAGIRQIIRLALFLRRHRFDVFQSHDLYSTLLGVPAAWLAGVPLILSSRRDLASWWWYTSRNRWILRQIQNRSNRIIANSQAVKEFLVHEDGFDPGRIRVLRNGVDFERFAKAPRDREKLFPNLAGEDKLIAVVANMNVKSKGHSELVLAGTEICREFTEAKFLFIGDGVERSHLQRMVGELDLRDRFLFLGRRNDVAEILACCDLFVLPSWAEGLPNSVLEAMAAGVPVVATRVGGIPEIIEDGVGGLLVPAQNPQALAAAIAQALRDPERARQLARVSQARARAEFSYERLLAELDSLYREGLPRRTLPVEIEQADRKAAGRNPACGEYQREDGAS